MLEPQRAARRGSWSIALLGALLLAAPGAAAMTVAGIEGPSHPLTPGTETATYTIDVDIDCSSVLARVTNAGSWTTPYFVRVTGGLHVVASTTESRAVDGAPCQGGASTVRAQAVVQVTLRDGGLALQPEPVNADIRLQDHPIDAANATARWTVAAAPVAAIEVFQPQQVTLRDGRAAASLTVQNLGNTPLALRLRSQDAHATVTADTVTVDPGMTAPLPYTLTSRSRDRFHAVTIVVEATSLQDETVRREAPVPLAIDNPDYAGHVLTGVATRAYEVLIIDFGEVLFLGAVAAALGVAWWANRRRQKNSNARDAPASPTRKQT